MSSSSINSQLFQAKAGYIQNQADSSSIYSAGVWSFKNSTAVASVTITDAGNVGIGTASPINNRRVTIQNTVNNSTASALYLSGAYTQSGDTTGIDFGGTAGNPFAAVRQVLTNAINGASALAFYTSIDGTAPAERMRIDASGALILGSSAFTGTHFVRGRLEGTCAFQGTVTNVSNFDSGSLVVSGSGLSGKAFMGLSSIGGGGGAGFVFTRGGSYDTAVQVYTATSGAGALGALNAAGPYVASGGISWTNGASDERLKKNFEPTQGLAEVLQIEPIKYQFKTEEDSAPKRLGFKAQNIQPLIPEMVVPNGQKAEDGSDYLTITPDYLLPVLVKAIQELSAKNEALEARLAALESKP